MLNRGEIAKFYIDIIKKSVVFMIVRRNLNVLLMSVLHFQLPGRWRT